MGKADVGPRSGVEDTGRGDVEEERGSVRRGGRGRGKGIKSGSGQERGKAKMSESESRSVSDSGEDTAEETCRRSSRGTGKARGRQSMGRGGRLTVWEVNTSRLTTKLQWVVETCHRDIKIWRFFAHTQPTIYIRHEHKLK
jgi:hypothetical protein